MIISAACRVAPQLKSDELCNHGARKRGTLRSPHEVIARSELFSVSELTKTCEIDWDSVLYETMPGIAQPFVTLALQSTNSVLMIRPSRFYPNPETAADNAFQRRAGRDVDTLTELARTEFDNAVQTLRDAGIRVHLFEDTPEPEKPDAVFPNNWISTHHDGRVALFPMYSALRRRERRQDIIEELRNHYRVTEVIDYSPFEEDGCCLEGTGSLVFDHPSKIAYVSLSNRSNPKMIQRFADDFDYESVTFTSIGPDGEPIYHTNV